VRKFLIAPISQGQKCLEKQDQRSCGRMADARTKSAKQLIFATFGMALKNADIQILGHPHGRIYNFRLGLRVDWAQVLDLGSCRRTG
jgi:hypothetical protein